MDKVGMLVLSLELTLTFILSSPVTLSKSHPLSGMGYLPLLKEKEDFIANFKGVL